MKCLGVIRWAIRVKKDKVAKDVDGNLLRSGDLSGTDACSESNELFKSVYSDDECSAPPELSSLGL